MVRAIILLMVLAVPALSWGYGYQHIVCGCVDESGPVVNVPVSVRLSLVNSGGMNIFYFASDTEQLTQNLYENVSKTVLLNGFSDVSGNINIDVSTNYNGNFSLECAGCGPSYKELFWRNMWTTIFSGLMGVVSLVVGAIAALAFAIGFGGRYI